MNVFAYAKHNSLLYPLHLQSQGRPHFNYVLAYILMIPFTDSFISYSPQ